MVVVTSITHRCAMLVMLRAFKLTMKLIIQDLRVNEVEMFKDHITNHSLMQ